jgi:type IV pilus modification protein PilV
MKAHLHRQRGFSMLEALVSMLVMAFGMLAVAAFQITLSRSSDLAKQRTEATRLAQEKLEALRTYGTVAAYGSQLVSSTTTTQEQVTTNATYTRSWGAAALNTEDTGRSIQVSVAWTDRAGGSHSVQLLSSVAETDPLDVGALMFPRPDGTILRRPMDRSIDIPIRATGISGTSRSYIPWAGSGGGYLVFSNDSGDVVQRCSSTPTAATVSDGTCTMLNAYLLTGYLSGGRATTTYVSPSNPVSFSSTQYMASAPECAMGPAEDQNTGATISGYLYYACLMEPTDHDSSSATARVWSGRSDITIIGSGSTKVCRYTSSSSTTDNNNHPATYMLVTRSLDNQNFYIDGGSCPAGTVLHN